MILRKLQIHGWRVLLGDRLPDIPTEQGRKDAELERGGCSGAEED